MATAALVDRNIEIGRQIVASLTRAKIPVTVYLWAFVSEEWIFIVATPIVDSKGPLAAYAEINRALQKAGLPDEIANQKIFLMSPSNRELRSLEKESKTTPYEAVRTVNTSIAGRFVEDAYVYSGIYIQEFESIPKGSPTYYVTYAPSSVTWAERSLEDLRRFLVSMLHVSPDTVELALKELSAKKSASIPDVQLRARDLKRLRPA